MLVADVRNLKVLREAIEKFEPYILVNNAGVGHGIDGLPGVEKRPKRYPTDLTDEGWEIIDPFLPPPPQRGRRPPTDLREALNAPCYLACSGGGCCRRTFRPGRQSIGGSGVLFAGCCCALLLDREREGREQGLTAAIVDRRSIKAPAPPQRGVDAAGKVVGRKRHIAVDHLPARTFPTAPKSGRSLPPSGNGGHGSSICVPTVLMIAPD